MKPYKCDLNRDGYLPSGNKVNRALKKKKKKEGESGRFKICGLFAALFVPPFFFFFFFFTKCVVLFDKQGANTIL